MDFSDLGYVIGYGLGLIIGLAGYGLAFIMFAELLKRLWRGIWK